MGDTGRQRDFVMTVGTLLLTAAVVAAVTASLTWALFGCRNPAPVQVTCAPYGAAPQATLAECEAEVRACGYDLHIATTLGLLVTDTADACARDATRPAARGCDDQLTECLQLNEAALDSLEYCSTTCCHAPPHPAQRDCTEPGVRTSGEFFEWLGRQYP